MCMVPCIGLIDFGAGPGSYSLIKGSLGKTYFIILFGGLLKGRNLEVIVVWGSIFRTITNTAYLYS